MKLTDAERANIEALFHALSDEFDACCAGDMIPPDLYAVFESIVAARLEQQREVLAAAIDEEAYPAPPEGHYWQEPFNDALGVAARIVREFGTEA